MNTKVMKKSFSDKTLSQKENKMGDDDKKNTAFRMGRSISDKTWLRKGKNKKDDHNHDGKNNRFLIIINVLGSTGPIRLVVNEGDNAAEVIQTALKLYARQKRLPILGSDINNFFLHPIGAEFEALEPSEAIGTRRMRNFVLCKKKSEPHMTKGRSEIIDHKGSGLWGWIGKFLSLKIRSQ